MNIHTVADNLRNTIAGKETMLAEMLQKQYTLPQVEARALSVTMEFLEINIDELKRILKDVEQCAKQASDDSWITNPDRMGGGGWTQDELDPNRGWK
jgi:hypothetical protein